MEQQISFEDLLNNPDILSKATYEVFSDGTHGSQQQQQQQQYTVPTHQIYYTQPQQSQQQLKTEAIEILAKEINDLKKRVKQLEEGHQKRTSVELPPINIPLHLSVVTSETDHELQYSNTQSGLGQNSNKRTGLGVATKKIEITKKKKTK